MITTSIASDGIDSPSVSIYMSYCDKPIKCKGCHNPQMQSDGYGILMSIEEAICIIEEKYNKQVKLFGKCKIVFLGGEPTSDININFVKNISKYFYHKNIITMMYTWKEYRVLNEEDIEYINYIVCGEYLENKKNDSYILGSTNQYIVNTKGDVIVAFRN